MIDNAVESVKIIGNRGINEEEIITVASQLSNMHDLGGAPTVVPLFNDAQEIF